MADNPSVMKPPSGTYGEGADLQKLRQSLPDSGARPAGPGAAPPPVVGPGASAVPQRPALPTPSTPGRPDTGGAPPPPGISPVLMGPTTQPGTPVSTPLMQPPQAPPVSPDQARLSLLFSLSSSPDVDPATREWASVVLEHLLGPGGSKATTLQVPPGQVVPQAPVPAAPAPGNG